MQKAKIFIFCTIFVAGGAFCQDPVKKSPQKLTLVFEKKSGVYSYFSAFRSLSSSPMVKPPVSPDFYSTHLGFFCRQEIKFEKATRVPFKFRLGSVQQCDRLEGKPNSFYNKE